MEIAIAICKYKKVSEIAHSIAGASAYCAANDIQHAASRLEELTRSENTESIMTAAKNLSEEIHRFIDRVSKIKEYQDTE